MHVHFSIFGILFCIFCTSALHSDSVTAKDRAILESFFRSLYGKNSVGYVVEGVKPACWLAYSSRRSPFTPHPKNEFDCTVSEGLRIWTEKIQPFVQDSANCIIHTYDKDEYGSSVFFINKKQLLQTVQDNIHLLQCILRPTINSEWFLKGLCQKRSAFSEENSAIMVLDPVILGIILGYGTENALCGGFGQKFLNDIRLPDVVPYTSKIDIEKRCSIREDYHRVSSRSLWSFPIETKKGKEQELQYLRMSEEMQRLVQLEKNCVEISKNLSTQSPVYPLVVYNEKSLPLETILQVRKKIQQDVDSPKFFQHVLEQFGVPKKIQDTLLQSTIEDADPQDEGYLSDIIAKSAAFDVFQREYTLEDRQLFLDGLTGHSDEIEPLDIQPSPHYIPNIVRMRENVRQSEAFFEQLRNKENMYEIVPGLLYSEIQKKGVGEKATATKVQIDYTIHQVDGKVIAEDTVKWFDLSETIPGFAYGIQGMQIGERRKIYIHPSLSYGLDTLLEKGVYLIADVTLLAVDDSNKKLPLLETKDVTYILNDTWFTKEKRQYQQTLRENGKALRRFLEKTTLSEKTIEKVKSYILTDKENVTLTDAEIKDLNSFFWTIYQRL